MRLSYDEDFVEEAVLFKAAGGRKGVSPLQIARFHREREKLYSVQEPDDRNAAFFCLHLDWFREWGLEKLLTDLLKEFPLLPNALKILAFRKSRGRNDEGTELYVNETGDRTGLVAMRPDLLSRELDVGAFLRHELMHLHDMVAPSFGYERELSVAGSSPNQHRQALERYRLLWDISIDGRLTLGGRLTVATKDQRWLEFVATFAFWSDARQRNVFESIWTDSTACHRVLAGLVCEPGQLQANAGPQPGALCPLCGFPTFSWAAVATLAGRIVDAIRADFPLWKPQQGVCARCSEIYRANRP